MHQQRKKDIAILEITVPWRRPVTARWIDGESSQACRKAYLIQCSYNEELSEKLQKKISALVVEFIVSFGYALTCISSTETISKYVFVRDFQKLEPNIMNSMN
jgi:hypothetical protein